MDGHLSKGPAVKVHKQMCKYVVQAPDTETGHRGELEPSSSTPRVPGAPHPLVCLHPRAKSGHHVLLKACCLPSQRQKTKRPPCLLLENTNLGPAPLCAVSSYILDSLGAFSPLWLH